MIKNPGRDCKATTIVKSQLKYIEHLDSTTIGLALTMLCGSYLGRGLSRTTFALSYSDDLVVKIEDDTSGQFQNALEWKIWNAAQMDYPKVAECLAPCVDISTCGRILIMKKTTPLPEDIKEAVLPLWLRDYQPFNLGMIDGKVVCHDYGISLPIGSNFGRTASRKILY